MNLVCDACGGNLSEESAKTGFEIIPGLDNKMQNFHPRCIESIVNRTKEGSYIFARREALEEVLN
jgi:hypothetical protein